MTTLFLTLITLGCGLALGYVLRITHARGLHNSIELETQRKIVAAESRVHAIIEKAEAKAEALEREVKANLTKTEEHLTKTEARLIKKEELLDTRQIDIDSQTEALRNKAEQIKQLRAALETRAASLDTKLAEIAGMSKDAAHAALIAQIEREHDADILARIHKLKQTGAERYDAEARNILVAAIHRIGNTFEPDLMTATIDIPSEEAKGRIIGKEGRNIKAFERATGVDVLVDETPGAITLSSFDPVRREIARVALEELLKTGRIQPARIEEVVEESRKKVAEIVIAMGEKAVYEAGVSGLHPDLVKTLGRLHFRTSYGQNVLWHSVEMAHIAAIIAEEVGADVSVARAGALLHDIGKVVSQEVSGTHVEIGIRILQKYSVDERVILAMRAHHEEYPYETPESIIVQVADALSGGRPGARRDSLEHYIRRLSEIEQIASSAPGVLKAYAIQAGREVRVLVNPKEVTDYAAERLARTIATEIEQKLRYPGEIKVHVLRETRAVSYAR